jgi:hypothetical protein
MHVFQKMGNVPHVRASCPLGFQWEMVRKGARHVKDMSKTCPGHDQVYMNHEHHGFMLQQFAEHSGLQAEGGAGAGSGVISVV